MGHWYRHTIIDAGREGVFWMLIAFVLTFVLTRVVTRRIRAEQDQANGGGGLIRDLHVGGVHIHHQVWGILIILVSALLEFAYQPASPWLGVLGGAFGVGAALTLDEFALWFHLDDVYWSRDGLKSIDAVVVGACVCTVLLLGTAPLGVDDTSAANQTLGTLAVTVLVNGVFSLVCFLKGKLMVGVIGLLVPLVALVGAVRLAKPRSPWARWWYRRRPHKLERAERRCARDDARWDRVRTVIGGAPTGGS